MTAQTPEQVIELFSRALNSRDVDAAIFCTSQRQRLRLDPARRRVACRRSGTLSSSSRRSSRNWAARSPRS
jgi:hypothetical protein